MSEQMLSQRRVASSQSVESGAPTRPWLTLLMLLSLFAGIDLVAEEVSAASDADGDGLTYGLST